MDTSITENPPDPSDSTDPTGLIDSGVTALPLFTAVATAWQDGLRNLETELKAAGRAEGTRKVRGYWAGRFAVAMTTQLRAPWDLGDGTPFVGRGDVVAWLATGQWFPETRRSVTASIRLFYRAGQAGGFTAVNPAHSLPSVYVPPAGPRPAPDDVIAGALDGAALRDWLAIGLMGACGLRREEACLVRTEHLVWRGRGGGGSWMLRVMGKGRRRREVPVPPGLARVILQQTPGWLFPGPNGHLTKDYLGKLVRRRLPGPWTPHTLRHAAATAWGDQGLEIDEISALLGHSRTDTTRVYLARHSHRAVAAVHQAAGRLL
jgi:integrase/recombinase XerC